MASIASGSSSFTVALPNEQATHRLALDIANTLEPGDVVTLSGDLGAGKTTLARAVIRRLADDATIEAPSPTFTLIQEYDLPRFPLVHADFYRVSDASELAELGLDDLPEGAVLLIEWPERAADFLPADRLDIALAVAPQIDLEHRDARVTGYGSFAARVERLALLRRFLADNGFAAIERRRITSDASSRVYDRLTRGDWRAILMNAPRRADGPPIRNGRPYSAIAHLAEDVKPFVAMANGLRACGFSAPEIYAADLANGFLVLEDLGSQQVVQGSPPAPIPERYGVAVETLVALHREPRPETLPLPDGGEHRIPPYDLEAFLVEIELLLEWYLPRFGSAPGAAARDAFLAIWREALRPVLAEPRTWVLRDYHSPNLLWLPEREGIARIGLIDFQDALIGPSAYDLASLLQDARVDVPEPLEIELLGRYVRARRSQDQAFDLAGFAAAYATLAAQRASKILGIFARLDRRDGKPQYLAHLPRVWRYLQRALAHPALAPLEAWYKAFAPPPERGARAARR